MADVIPDKIEPTEGVGCAPHDAAGEVVLAQITDQSQTAATRGCDLADHGVDPRLVDVDHADGCTFPGKAQSTRPAHSGCRRRDDADLAIEPHGFASSPSLSRDVFGVVKRVESGAMG